jgi:predicted double-glycine peptidase
MRSSFAVLVLWLAASTVASAQTASIPPMGVTPGVRVPVTSIQEAKTKGTVLQQYDFSCGSAAVATLLTHHYGYPVTEQEVLEKMFATGDHRKIQTEGFSMLDMKRYLKSVGFEADGFRQTLDKLAEAKLPAIVLINEGNYHHFVVVKGVARNMVLIGDPARGTKAMPRKEFEKIWIGGLLFVVHNQTDKARFNQASDWRAAPWAPLASGVARDAFIGTALPKHGPGDF